MFPYAQLRNCGAVPLRPRGIAAIASLAIVGHDHRPRQESPAGTSRSFLARRELEGVSHHTCSLSQSGHPISRYIAPHRLRAKLTLTALYLQTLTFAEDGNPDHVEPHGLLNWRKYGLLGDLMKELWHFQQSHYAIEDVPELADLLRFDDVELVPEKQLYMLSLEVESRDAIERAKKELELRKETLKIQKQMQKQQKEEEKRKEKEEKQIEKERKKEEKERRRAAGEEKEKVRVSIISMPHLTCFSGSGATSALVQVALVVPQLVRPIRQSLRMCLPFSCRTSEVVKDARETPSPVRTRAYSRV